MTRHALEVVNLKASYGSVQALTGVTFTLRTGTVCGLIGMNGSGKSTLLKAIMGSIRSSGSIQVLGLPPHEARQRGLIGYVPQAEGVDWNFPVSVYDVVMMGRYGYMGFTRHPKTADKKAVAEALDMVDLMDLRHRQIGALSGGQRKRAFIARAIAQKAKLMLLDEPFAGVDKPSETMISSLLRNLSSKETTLLVATHDLAGLGNLCDETLLLLRRIIFHGPVDEALQPENLNVAFGLEKQRN